MSMLPESLSLPVDDVLWTRRDRFDKAAVALADRHYSREKPGTPQLGGPGYLLVFVTPCERAAWVSKRHSPEIFEGRRSRTTADGFQGYRCGLFRNESDHRASDLIRAAVELTERFWGPSPQGWLTYVDRSKVASRNPGYCFKKAGWVLDREYDHPRLVRLLLPPALSPVPVLSTEGCEATGPRETSSVTGGLLSSAISSVQPFSHWSSPHPHRPQR